MKKLNILFVFIFLLCSQSSFCQSDYQILQNFKANYNKIEQSIKNVDSLSTLQKINDEIDQFSDEYVINKELLDKSLYPDDFLGSIEKLKNQLNIRRGDFTKITTLQTQVSSLQQQFDQLNLQNTELINQVKKLEEQSKNDKSKLAQLERSISELKSSMQKRDQLVMNMLDSLMPAGFVENRNLTGKEKQKVFSKAEETNVISNVKRAINDNIRFLEITTLKPDDINEIKKQQNEFRKTWQNIGPAIIDIYSERGQNIKNLKGVDSSFVMWNSAISMEAWNSIRQDFTDNGIYLNKFSNGEEFTSTIKNYINDQIKNADVKNGESINTYQNFADSVWSGNIKPNWVPFLIENKMLSDSQKDTIETKIAQWKDKASPSSFNWLYILIAILLIIAVIFFIRKSSSRKSGRTS